MPVALITVIVIVDLPMHLPGQSFFVDAVDRDDIFVHRIELRFLRRGASWTPKNHG
jgi:hypothetical protein